MFSIQCLTNLSGCEVAVFGHICQVVDDAMLECLWWLCNVTFVWCTAHQDRVTCVQFSPVHEFVLSCSRDKYFEWHCSQTGRRLGGYLASAWTTCLQYLSSFSSNIIAKRSVE